MKKTNRLDIPGIGEVKFVHSLRLNGDELKSPNWKAAAAQENHDLALVEKLAQLNALTNQHLPNYPDFTDPKCLLLSKLLGQDFAKLTKIKWRLMRNSANYLHAFATIPFNNSENASLILSESFAQYFTEALSHFGARYGRSATCWVLYLPNFASIAFIDLQTEFVMQIQLSWARLSNAFQKFTLQTIITPELLLGQSNPQQEQGNSNYNPTFFLHKKQPISMVKVMEAINKINDPLQRNQLLQASKFGSLDHVKAENSFARISLLKSLILMEYLSREKIPHVFYSEIIQDTFIHLSIKQLANELLAKKDLLFAKNSAAPLSADDMPLDDKINILNINARDPQFILIINLDINTEYPLLNKMLDEAVNATREEEQIFFRVTGPLTNLSLEQVDNIGVYDSQRFTP